MPPPCREAARNYFIKEVDSDGNLTQTCTMCTKIIKGDHYHNLKRHIISTHPDEVHTIEKDEELENNTSIKKRKISNTAKNAKNNLLRYGTLKVKKKNLMIGMSYNDVELAYIKLVTLDGRPFSCVNDDGLKGFTDPIIKALNDGLSTYAKMTPYKRRKIVQEEANNLRQFIGERVKNKLICLKMDGGTRLGRKFLGVNIQFREGLMENDFKIFTLACIELSKSQTSENLCAELEEIFKRYGIQNSQLYTATTDNGRNFVKAVSLLEENESNENGDEWDAFDVEMQEITEEEENMLEDVFTKLKVTGIRCFEHTFQLAVEDWLDSCGFLVAGKLIDKVRDIVKTSRTPTMRQLFSQQGFKKVLPLDCKTRWGTMYIMLKTVVEAKSAIETYKTSYKVPLTAEDWKNILKIKETMEPSYELTIRMQKNDVMLSELHKYWLECIIKLKKMGHEWSTTFVNDMNERGKKLFNDDCFLSNIYLDPRFKCTVSFSHIERVKSHLRTLHNTIIGFQNEKKEIPKKDNSNKNSNQDEESELDSLITELSNGGQEDTESLTNSVDAFQHELECYKKEK